MAVGRPPKLTEPIKARFLEAIRAGDTIVNACAYAGISQATFYHWQTYARDPERRVQGLRRELIQFLETYREYEAEALAEAVREVRRAGQGTAEAHKTIRTITHPDGKVEVTEEVTLAAPEWRASAWFLERRQPKAWGRRDRTPVDVEAEAERLARELGVPVEDLLAEAELLAQSE